MVLGFSAKAIALSGNLASFNNTAQRNNTSSEVANSTPNFIRPSANPTANCNLWGPLCQTGSIVVSVNLTTTVTTTTVPCSNYLSAQAESAKPGYLTNRGKFYNYMPPNSDYQASFGRSPECKSYVDHFVGNFDVSSEKLVQDVLKLRTEDNSISILSNHDNHHPITIPSGTLTLPNCGHNQLQHSEYYTPPGVSNSVQGSAGKDDYYCCGDCSLFVSEIRLLYPPGATTSSCSLASHGVTSSSSVLHTSFSKIDNRAASLLTNGPVSVDDGYTYNPSSFYLQIVGKASVSDSCGMVGSVYTNPTVAVPMGCLSTILLNISIGATFTNRNFDRGFANFLSSYTKAVRTEDLICPTWGLANNLNLGEAATVGSPFNPIIHPPSELINLDPAWRQCTRFVETANVGGAYIYEVFDPPRALSSVAGITPPSTSADQITLPPIGAIQATQNPAKPAISIQPILPEITPKPSTFDPQQSVFAPPKSSRSADPGRQPLSDFGRFPTTAAAASVAKAFQTTSSVSSETTVLQALEHSGSVSSSDRPLSALPKNQAPSEYTKHGIGATIYNILGGKPNGPFTTSNDPTALSDGAERDSKTTQGFGEISSSAFDAEKPEKTPENDGISSTVLLSTFHPPKPTFVVEGSSLIVDPSSAISIVGTTIFAGGSGVNIPETSVSIGPSAIMVEGSIVPVQSAALDSTVVSAASQAATINDPSTVAVGGTTLSIGGDPVTLAHTIISLAPSGKLMIKPEEGHDGDLAGIFVSETSNLVSQGSSSIANIGGYNAMTATPAVFTVAGKDFTANPSAFSIDGTMLSAGGAGIIISGTSISLASSGHLIIGSNTATLLSQTIFKVAGQKFTANPSAFSMDSTTLSIGGAGITISGTPISLGPSGKLMVGSSTVTLSPPPTNAPPLSTFTIDGQTYIGNASELSLDGNTLLAGGTGLTISGTPISLEASGSLRVGSSDIPLATNGSLGQGRPEEFTGAQKRPAIPSAIVLLGAMVLVIGIIEVAMWRF